jgi:hypothetical protein
MQKRKINHSFNQPKGEIMKSLLFKAVAVLVMLLPCSYSFAAITHYENTDTNSLVYGSYEFNDALNAFSNIALKMNFTKLGGPTDVVFDPDTLKTVVYADGSRSDTYYMFRASSILFKEIPSTLVVSEFARVEAIINGVVIDWVHGFTDPDFPAELVYFKATQGNVSNVPEPEVISLLALSPIMLLARRRKQQKQ